ncbi:hypothetical protein APED_23560 [Acanthopleuribacter pedis]|uniref:hypothetical protein n=1 Tax=Acanthopleuribacter pedis TaxID=442870 RepID=UPI001A9FBE3A|nr:hypothetical protein [Acanthopleuribacter pedis]
MKIDSNSFDTLPKVFQSSEKQEKPAQAGSIAADIFFGSSIDFTRRDFKSFGERLSSCYGTRLCRKATKFDPRQLESIKYGPFRYGIPTQYTFNKQWWHRGRAGRSADQRQTGGSGLIEGMQV